MRNRRVLIVDDESGARVVLERSLGRAGYQVHSAENGVAALKLFTENPFPVVITDINMPGMNGLELLRRIHETNPETCVVIITAYADLKSAVEALRNGAYDYIFKPLKPDLMVKAADRAFEKWSLRNEVRYLQRQFEDQFGFDSIIGGSKAMRETIRMAQKIAPTDESVLITGESGTGKELFARAIHLSSLRKNRRFVAVNCGALPENLVESELFGHKKGAFTNATADKIGLITEADGGSIFLDEVSEFSQALQVKLLRFLQDHYIRPVGAVKESHVNVRVIAATNRSLDEEVKAGRFREDLYYRLRVLVVSVPPLREHPEDVPVLMKFFLDKFAKRSGFAAPNIPEEVMRKLAAYEWGGNVRELENLAKHLIIMTDGPTVVEKDIISYLGPTAKDPKPLLSEGLKYSELRSKVLERFNQQIITEALNQEGWNISRAAIRLGTAKSNVVRLMKKFNLSKQSSKV